MFQDLRALLVFAHVVEEKSFSGAAERLGVTKSAVSKMIAGLEAALGVQLLVRTTRKLALTEVGERVYASCSRLAGDVSAAEQAAATHRSVVVGHLRVTAPAVLGRDYLVPLVTEFLEQHPRVDVELDLRDQVVDLVDERIDCALRVGRGLSDSTMIVRRIADVRMLLCAAPSYLSRRGTPRTPRDVEHHELVIHAARSEPVRLEFRKGKTVARVVGRGRFACLDGAAIVAAAAAGQGLVVAPEYEVGHEVAEGRLVRVLPSWQLDRFVVSAVFPPRKQPATKARAFVELVASRWQRPPWRV